VYRQKEQGMATRAGKRRAKRNAHRGARETTDFGPPERRNRGGGLLIEETMEAGRRRARVRYECLLDLLLASGQLGEPREARRRYDAGLWLRRLYQRTHDDVLTQRYDTLGRDGSEMSDEMALEQSLYRRTLLAMGPEFAVLRRVCCDDRPTRVSLLRRALDRLADWRGL
jgi:hypothetical protein